MKQDINNARWLAVKNHSRYFSEDNFKALGSQNKELYIVPGATHVDLYDNQANKIPFDKFENSLKPT